MDPEISPTGRVRENFGVLPQEIPISFTNKNVQFLIHFEHIIFLKNRLRRNTAFLFGYINVYFLP